MATQSWGGGVSGDWDTAGNWSTGKPGASDTVLFPASSTQAVTTGCDNEAGIDLTKLWVQEGFNADIGSGGTPLQISSGLVIFEGGGKLFYEAGTAATDVFIIKARPATANITSVTLTGTGTTDYDDIHVKQGTVSIGSSLDTITLLTIMGQSIVTIGSGNTITNMRIAGGTVNASSIGTTTIMSGGVLTLDTVITSTTFEVWGGTANLTFGSTYTNTIKVFGGVVDLTRSASLKTVDDIELWGGQLKINDNVTLGSATAIKFYGGQLVQ